MTVDCDLCGKPVEVSIRARKMGQGRFHARCAQIARTLGRKNPNYKRGHRSYHSTRINAARRAAIHERDDHRCVQCGRISKYVDPINGKQLDVHHVIPVADGGPDTDDNLCTLCRRCHNNVEHGRVELKWRFGIT